MSETAGDPKGVQDQERRLALERNAFIREFREALSTPGGRHVIWALLERCHIYQPSYVLGQTDMSGSAFLEGERSIGLFLIGEVFAHCPVRYGQMVEEAGERARNIAAASAAE